jgi:formylglycine-generating enzyme required for sulfatase activity
MIGNALEWCSDYYGEYADDVAVNPQGSAKGDKIGARVLRGGSWYNRPQDIRVGFRHSHSADYQLNVIGFRLARRVKLFSPPLRVCSRTPFAER